MKKCMPALLCALLLLLSSCRSTQPSGEELEGGYQVYFMAPLEQNVALVEGGGPSMVSETRRVPEGADPLAALMECLLAGPVSSELESPFPEGVRQLSPPTVKGDICHVNLSEKYGSLSGVTLTMADYCIALTLCQVSGVEAVSIDVEGDPIPYRSRQLLRPNDVVLSGGEDEAVNLSVDLYFLRRDGGLSRESCVVPLAEQDVPAVAVLNALLAGPKSQRLYLPFPENTQLLSAWVENGECYVNFDAPFLSEQPDSQDEAQLLLYAIVNTLCQLPNIESVQILVDGEAPERYGGVPTSSPLEPNGDLVVQGRSSS